MNKIWANGTRSSPDDFNAISWTAWDKLAVKKLLNYNSAGIIRFFLIDGAACVSKYFDHFLWLEMCKIYVCVKWINVIVTRMFFFMKFAWQESKKNLINLFYFERREIWFTFIDWHQTSNITLFLIIFYAKLSEWNSVTKLFFGLRETISRQKTHFEASYVFSWK